MAHTEDIHEVTHEKPNLQKPPGSKVYYPPESQSPKKRLEQGQVARTWRKRRNYDK
jgi:hypothetical protein